MTRTFVFLMRLVVVLPSDGSSQAVPSLGHRIRIKQVDGTVLTGRLALPLSPETIQLWIGSDDLAEVPVARIIAQPPSPTSGSNYLVAGVVVGGLVGALGGWALHRVVTADFCDPAEPSYWGGSCSISGPNSTESALIGAAVGALLGGLIGWSAISSAQDFSVYPYRGASSGLGLSARAFIPLRTR